MYLFADTPCIFCTISFDEVRRSITNPKYWTQVAVDKVCQTFVNRDIDQVIYVHCVSILAMYPYF